LHACGAYDGMLCTVVPFGFAARHSGVSAVQWVLKMDPAVYVGKVKVHFVYYEIQNYI
jgi:hypothetical protein